MKCWLSNLQKYGKEMAATLDSLSGGAKKTASDMLNKQGSKAGGPAANGISQPSVPPIFVPDHTGGTVLSYCNADF